MATADIRPSWLSQVRRIALDLPEATEKQTWDHPTFRVRDKIFAGIGVDDIFAGTGIDEDVTDRRSNGTNPVTTMSMKATPGEQESLLASGHPFFRPRYVGHRGWIGVIIDDDTDWSEIEELVIDSYRTIAPKTLARQLDDPTP